MEGASSNSNERMISQGAKGDFKNDYFGNYNIDSKIDLRDMKSIEDELSKYSKKLEDNLSLNEIVELLDKFQNHGKFSRVLFFHVVEFARLNKTANIAL